MAKIIAVRHAESIANTKGIYQGQSYDTGLSPLGEKQAQALAERLVKYKIIRVITSPLIRSKQTAIIISKYNGCEMDIDKRLIETNHGKWEGNKKSWIKKHYPELLARWKDKPSQVVFPDGEKFEEVIKRVEKYLKNNDWQGNTLLVTHDNIIRVMVVLATNSDFDKMWSIPLEPAAITVFTPNRNGLISLLSLNDMEHINNLRAEVANHAL